MSLNWFSLYWYLVYTGVSILMWVSTGLVGVLSLKCMLIWFVSHLIHLCWAWASKSKEKYLLTFLRKNFRSYICGCPTHSKYRPHHVFCQAKISQLQGGSLVFISLNLQGIKTSKPSNCNWDKEGFWDSVRVQPGQSSNNPWKLTGYPRTDTSSWTSK